MTYSLGLYLVLITLGIVIGVFNQWYINKEYKLLVLLLIYVLLIEISAIILQKISKTNYPLYHTVPVLSCIFYGLIFHYLLKSSSIWKYWALFASVIFAFVSLIISICYQDFYSFPSIGLSLLGLFVTFCTLVLFTKMLLGPESKPLLKQPVFWFAIGSLIFYSSTFFVFGFFKSIKDTGSGIPDWGYTLIRTANYIMYTCYLITLWLAGPPREKTYHRLV